METGVQQKGTSVQLHGVVFVIMALVGSLMALGPAIASGFLAHWLPALIILICALAFYLWTGAGKAVKMVFAIVALVMGLWLLINVVARVALPALASAEQIVSGLMGGDLTVLTPVISLPTILYMGAVGGIVTLVGSIFGIVAACKS